MRKRDQVASTAISDPDFPTREKNTIKYKHSATGGAYNFYTGILDGGMLPIALLEHLPIREPDPTFQPQEAMDWGSLPSEYLALVKRAGSASASNEDKETKRRHQSVIRAGQWAVCQAYGARWSVTEWKRRRDVALVHLRKGRYRPGMSIGERLVFVITSQNNSGKEVAGFAAKLPRDSSLRGKYGWLSDTSSNSSPSSKATACQRTK